MITNHPLNDNIFYIGKWKNFKNENEKQINGKLFCTYKNLIKHNGYNENITTYGWDDDDLYIRLAINLEKKIIHNNDFNFIEHDDKSRLSNTKLNDTSISILLNKMLSLKYNILSWNTNNLQTEYLQEKDNFYIKNNYNLKLDFINNEIYTRTKTFLKLLFKKTNI